MTKGILVFARNNGHIDYVKQAAFLARRAQHHLGLPTTIVTDKVEYVEEKFPNDFDNVIPLEVRNDQNYRRFFDGAMSNLTASFNNRGRADAYNLSPYHETLVLDTDIVICNDLYKHCFESRNDFLIYQDSHDISNFRNTREFEYVSDYGIEFYWATCIFFRKTEVNKIFFDLVKHIQDNWDHYYRVYQLNSPMFRNDFAFSIAIHIMNGFQKGDFTAAMPGKLLYITDKDILWKLSDDKMIFLVEKEKHVGEYTLVKTVDQTVHVMNKRSLTRIIDEVING